MSGGSDRSHTYGAADEEVLVEIDNAKLSALGLSFQEGCTSIIWVRYKKTNRTNFTKWKRASCEIKR
jgi:hypothetical protein